MRVALAQIRSDSEPSANLELITDHIDRAAGRADLIVFPEATMSSFAGAAHLAAQPLDGPWAAQVRQLAAEADLTVVAGMFTPGTGRARNTLLVTGAAETHYDKLHLFDAFGQAESDDIEPGAALASFSLGTHQVGLATCYDVRFPALFTSLARGGAELIVLPASWASGPGKLHQWRTLVTARAMDSTSFVVAVDQAADVSTSSASGEATRHGPATGIGHSMVVGPTGEVLLELGDGPELAFIELDLAEVPATRLRLPVLAHTRPLP
jgi:Predicted amidohydrolase